MKPEVYFTISLCLVCKSTLTNGAAVKMANLEHSVPVTPETVFHIDSISKNILSAVVLQLVDEGKLRLDDDVTKYVPEAPTQGHHVTVGQLRRHEFTNHRNERCW